MRITKLGRYDLVGVLGSGAMGFVYEGFDPNLKRRVAIKTINVNNLSKAQVEEYEFRFSTEAHSAARLQHPNVVSVYDSDRHDGVAFLVMEYVHGKDLKQQLEAGTLYSLKQTVSIVVALLAALEYAHAHGIVHRDVKPANVLITEHGHVKLTDFGVARIEDSGEATRTQGTVVGTLKYMSPEQIQGLPVDARADLFAAGVVLYQLLTGVRPFDADTDFGVIQKVVSQSPETVTSLNTRLPPAIDLVVSRSLAKSRDERYSSASEFALALSDACRNSDALDVVPTIKLQPNKKRSNAGAASDHDSSSSLTPSQTTSNIPTATFTGTTAIADEIELVYWKEIKDTNDIEDLNVFLVQFPAGIYAPLAKRRRRQLSDQTGANTLTQTPSANQRLSIARDDYSVKAKEHCQTHSDLKIKATAVQDDREFQLPQSDAYLSPAEQILPNETLGHSRSSVDSQPSITRKSRPGEPTLQPVCSTAVTALVNPTGGKRFYYAMLAALAALVLIIAAVLGLGQVEGEAPLQTSQVAATSNQGSKSSLEEPMKLKLPITNTVPNSVEALAAPLAKPLDIAEPKMSLVTSKAALHKPMATDKADVNLRPRIAAKVESADRRETNIHPNTAPTAPSIVGRAVSTNPRQLCEDRLLLGFQICISEQCQKPAFFNHVLCVERRKQDQQRRDQELYR